MYASAREIVEGTDAKHYKQNWSIKNRDTYNKAMAHKESLDFTAQTTLAASGLRRAD